MEAGRESADFSAFAAPLLGMKVSDVWQGHGSALGLEFGNLSTKFSRDGSQTYHEGEMSLLLEWSWRIEGRRSIICGSWTNEIKWLRSFRLLRGATVAHAAVFGHLPEIEIRFTNGVRLLSFMTAEGDPQWTLFHRSPPGLRWMMVRRGMLQIDEPRFRKLEKLGEKIYDEMYRTSNPRGLLSEIKECFDAAIADAERDGSRRDAIRLRARLEHISLSYRRFFS